MTFCTCTLRNIVMHEYEAVVIPHRCAIFNEGYFIVCFNISLCFIQSDSLSGAESYQLSEAICVNRNIHIQVVEISG